MVNIPDCGGWVFIYVSGTRREPFKGRCYNKEPISLTRQKVRAIKARRRSNAAVAKPRLSLGLCRVNKARWRERDSGRPRTEGQAVGYVNEVGLRQKGVSGVARRQRREQKVNYTNESVAHRNCSLPTPASSHLPQEDRKERRSPEFKSLMKGNICILLEN